MLLVKTKHADYLVDRQNERWKRTSKEHPHDYDGEWVDGGFTVGFEGTPSFAHFANHPKGAAGRWTSSLISVSEVNDDTLQ